MILPKEPLFRCLFRYFKLLSIFLLPVLISCTENQSNLSQDGKPSTWAEKLGFPEGKKIIMLHADDIGMCDEANIAAMNYLEENQIQSAAIMVPCPFAEDAIQWSNENPSADVGLHITHTSEWKTYRWGPVAKTSDVPGLVDADGKLWRKVEDVVINASPQEVEIELRAQIEKAISLGMKPSHIDTHMGTLYGSSSFLKVFLKVAEEYNIPANAIDLSKEEVAEHFRKAGYPLNDEAIKLIEKYSLPKLDFFASVPKGKTYEEKRDNFFELVKSLPNGITEIIFHPSVETENLKTITNSWQQRIWEAEMFADPVVKDFLNNNEILFTNWTDLMERFRKFNNS